MRTGLAKTESAPEGELNVRRLTAATASTLAILLIFGVMVAGCSPFASKGTMPPPGPNGQVDASSAPDFLAVAGRDGGIAGYAPKADVLGAGDAAYVVYGEDLRTVVGQMARGRVSCPSESTQPPFRPLPSTLARRSRARLPVAK
jgi:hypothetical protein